MKDKSEVEIVDLVLKLREKLVGFPPVLVPFCVSVSGSDQGHRSWLLLCSLIWRTGKRDSYKTLVVTQ